MASKTSEAMAERTRKIRLEVHRLMTEKDLSENEALRRVFPGDRNRTKKLKRWKDNGLWPIPEPELREIRAQSESSLSRTVNNQRQCSEPVDELSENELLKRVRIMLDKIEPVQRLGLTAPGRKSSVPPVMIALRVPKALDEELKSLGGLKSRHIEKAIMLYIRAVKAGGDAERA